jgi:hypothetical protein
MIWHAIRVVEESETAVRGRIGTLAFPRLPMELVDGPRMSSRLVPLIPGYLFLGFPGAPNWLAIRRIKCVIEPLGMVRGGPPHVFPAEDVHGLEALSRRLIHERQLASAAPRRPERRRRPRKSRRAFVDIKASLDAMPGAAWPVTEELEKTVA